MAWIPSHQTLRDHRKVKRVARQLNLSIPCVIGHLHLLWWWALDQAPDGDLSICDEQDIADAMMYEGNALQLRNVLVACGGKDGFGFLEISEGRLIIHDWPDYGGKYIAQKERTRARVTRYRALRNACVTLLEERREDKKRVEDSTNGVAAKPPRAPKFVPPSAEEITAFFISSGSSQKQAGLFYDHYVANGWKVGRNPMKDWKAAARGWIAREGEFSNGAARLPDEEMLEKQARLRGEATQRMIDDLRQAEQTRVDMPGDLRHEW